MKIAAFLTSRLGIQFLALLAMIVFPGLSMAQETEGMGFDLPEDDLSRRVFIDPLFGPISGSETLSPLTGIIKAFNGALLFLGGILLAYTIVAGTLSTAHDGEMMGKKWSSVWLPIRTSLGAAAVLPVVGGGWCVAQVLVVWLAMQGAGLANGLWSAFLDNGESVLNASTYNPPHTLTAVEETYVNMLIASVCVASQEGEESQSDPGDFSLMAKRTYEMVAQKDDATNSLLITYGRRPIAAGPFSLGAPGECGVVRFVGNSTIATDTWQEGTGVGVALSGLSNVARDTQRNAMQQVYDARLPIMEEARKIVQDGSSPEAVRGLIDGLVAKYEQEVTEAARLSYTNAMQGAEAQRFLEGMKADGWVMAGSYYMLISRIQSSISNAISNLPTTVTGDPSLMPASVKSNIARAREYLHASGLFTLRGAGTSLNPDSQNIDEGWSTTLVNWFLNNDAVKDRESAGGLISASTRLDTTSMSGNPILMAKEVGEKMTAIAWGALALAAAAGMATLFGAGAGTASIIAPIFALLFSSFLVPGAILSTYLPMLPYILWLGVTLGWAVLLIEAIIAAPLWAIVHLAPDGDGVVGRGGQGYMLVLSLVLRPPLMIIGLVAAFVLMMPIGFLLNSTLAGAFALAVEPGPFALTQTIAGLIIYTIIMIIVVQRVFSLIHVIPDRMLRWIGGGGGELGQEAEALGQGSYARIGAALGTHQAIGAAAQQGVGQAAANIRQNKTTEATKNAEMAQIAGNDSDRADRADRDLNREMASYSDRADDGNVHKENAQALRSTALAASAAHQRSAMSSAKAEGKSSPEAADFVRGAQKAQARGELDQFMQNAGQQAAAAEARGERLPPYQRELSKMHAANTVADQASKKAETLPSANALDGGRIADDKQQAPPAPNSNDPSKEGYQSAAEDMEDEARGDVDPNASSNENADTQERKSDLDPNRDNRE